MISSSKLTENRLVDPTTRAGSEDVQEQKLRPVDLAEVIGMEREKANLRVMIESANKRSDALDHILFHGPPGLGKTSLALAVATEMRVPVYVTTGPAITKAGDLAAIVTSLQERAILFVDEIHRLRSSVEELLYPAMEDGVMDIVIGKGPGAKTLRLDLPKFTLIGATTKLAMLSSPLRSRFGVDFRVDFYSNEELREIVKQKARKLAINISDSGAEEIARRSRMTARIAVRILKRVRDMAVVDGIEDIDTDTVKKVLTMLDIDDKGLDVTDRKILQSMYYKFAGKPVGLNTLAATISEDPSTVEDVYEPFLLQKGLIERTPRGRAITSQAIEYILKMGTYEY